METQGFWGRVGRNMGGVGGRGRKVTLMHLPGILTVPVAKWDRRSARHHLHFPRKGLGKQLEQLEQLSSITWGQDAPPAHAPPAHASPAHAPPAQAPSSFTHRMGPSHPSDPTQLDGVLPPCLSHSRECLHIHTPLKAQQESHLSRTLSLVPCSSHTQNAPFSLDYLLSCGPGSHTICSAAHL